MSFISEFKEFAMKGNVVDLAVGVIIGTAFGKIVSSFVGDVVMPLIGMLTGGVNFSDMAFKLKDAVGVEGAPDFVPALVLKYGAFAQTVFDFTVIALAVFLAIKAMNKMKRKEEAVPEAPAALTNQEVLLGEIRDLLKQK
ncbi:large-conductance mechanosensitive channel protein MscL [Thiothrix fructosivorans]|uniref:Large-conductance mechanosensitive channel n=1 Tax=Thiothrix fructosivorans TaxID=111770 RepID=A0A8B0SHD2_9GAMM|nr:large-conductance mechanosensitive channel protein MscL [Thiothrix fructosivorans]MBO0613918.1 large-conductance mechanosensitive channel protein MscL [Thiothrix fructosivorans]QTX10285.1 large-conductance mechanosensitive channel protein MscL [Thiothrix fructosivorans]